MAQADGMVAVLETKTLLFTKLQALEQLISCLENGHIGDEGSKILQDVEDAIVKGELVLQKREKDLNYVDSLENDQDFVFKQLKRLLNIIEKRRRRATTLFCSENNRKHFLLFVNPKKVQHSLHPRIQVTSERKIPVYLHPGQSPLADKGRRRVPHLSIPYRAVIKGKYSHLPQRLGKQIQPHSGTVTTYGSCAYRSSSCDFDNDSHKFYSFQQMIAADVTGMRYAERCDSANNQVSFNMVDHDACRTSHCFDEKQGKINSIESMPAWSCRELEKTKPIFASDDEFWEALQSDYDYLMDEELMKTCKETSDELSLSSPNDETPFTTSTWSFTELINNFNVLQNSLSHLISVIMKINKWENKMSRRNYRWEK
ncbi:uncharacterized protein LOC106473594 [Limulus polyphemus]|uniref:Uncharacterized protein LOC106473594 n=1 Tax=Limulus polyphemus TaxID=6850 RepID=A0ABM1BVY9_LIMPO|nr:uncharacterized protein LOC106473594 [Limulus polyphemus]